ncbi:MAG: DHHW family protein [Clostridium sp.]|nr:DHHW family protein [Acetatifactor muris]MCM1527308.1 DHHW family protein [Bacteroides sp.]MCM1563587.1 DHHW family protein [Clostridium sp.]
MNCDMTKIRNRIVGIIFIVFLTVMIILVLLGAQRKMEGRETQDYTEWDAMVYYPLDVREESDVKQTVWQGISDKIEMMETKVEQNVTTTFFFRIPFVFRKKMCDKLLGLDMTTSLTAGENDISDFSDIVLTYEGTYLGCVVDDIDISKEMDNVITFGKQMEAEGRNFLFFETPGKYVGNEIYQNHSAEKEAELLQAFEANGLDLFRVTGAIEEEGLDFCSLFFKTDHHWLPSTGIWADGLLCEELNGRYGYHFDTSVFEMSNYETTVLEGRALGSLGKKVTEVYDCEKEDFPIILPRYNTDLEVFISGSNRNETVCGSMENVLFDVSVFDEPNCYLRNDYGFYGYSDRALITVHNSKVDDGSHILMIKESYANCMIPYLAAVVEDLDVIDLRHFGGSLQAYIDETNPDTVVMVYGIGAFQEEEIEGGPFDFR